MWKVTNNVNKTILNEFNKSIIEQFFRILMNLSYKIQEAQISKPSLTTETWKLSKYYNSSKNNLFDHIFNIKYKKIPMIEVMNQVLIDQDLSSIINYYKIYKEQNDNINKFLYSIKNVKIDKNLSKIFKNYFYETMFNDEYIWTEIYGQVYSRAIFHKNFTKENNDIGVCPYCDLDTFLSKANKNVEHMLPKSKFPFLSMNGNNLISSCCACNSSSDGKGVLAKSPITFPYIIEIGEYLDFNIKRIEKKIYLSLNKKMVTDANLEKQLNNYLNLLKLKKRYGENEVFNSVDSKIEVIYDCISGFKYDKVAFEIYISKSYSGRSKKETLMFSIKNSLKNYNDYRIYFGIK